MKIADYGKAITSYIESPTTAQKLKSKKLAGLMEEYLGDQLDYQKAVDEGFQGTEEEYRRYKSTSEEDRVFLAEGSEDIAEPSKSMQVDTTTKPLPLFTLDDFKFKANTYVGALYNGALPAADIKAALNKFTQKGIDDGTFSADDAIKVVQDLKYQFQDRAQKQRLRDNIIAGTGTVERKDFYAGSSLEQFSQKIKDLYLSGEGTKRINQLLKFKGDKTTTIDDLIQSMKNPEINTPVKISAKELETRPLAIGKNQAGTPAQVKERLINFFKKYVKKNKELPSFSKLREIADFGTVSKAIESGEVETMPASETRSKAQSKKGNLQIIRLSKDPYIRNIFKTGIVNPAKDLARVKELLGITSDTVAGSRLQKLADIFAGETKLKGVKPTFVENAKKVQSSFPYRNYIRDINEKKIGTSVGEKSIKADKSYIRNRPEYKISDIASIDEPAGVKSSVKQGSTPYGIFGQIINTVLNKTSKFRFDALKSRNEKILNDAIEAAKAKGVDYTKDKNVLAAVRRFNNDVVKYEKILNKKTKKGDLPVKLFKVSLKDPSLTVARFNDLPESYRDAFNKVYKEKGYSFQVPKDIKTIPEIRKLISEKPDQFKKDLGRRGAPRMLSINFPLTGYFAQKDFFEGKNIIDVATGSTLGVRPIESLLRTMVPEEEGGFSEPEKIALKKLNILETIKPSDITTIASLADKDPEYKGTPAQYLDFLKSQNLESIVEPAEKEFQEKIMKPYERKKAAERSAVFSGLDELTKQFTGKYDPEEVL
mgnify:CR=1 FL=1